jgi:hypothetical protein
MLIFGSLIASVCRIRYEINLSKDMGADTACRRRTGTTFVQDFFPLLGLEKTSNELSVKNAQLLLKRAVHLVTPRFDSGFYQQLH